MAFTDHKITAFQKKLADLPDQPNLSAAELKAYFDSSPEELRQAHNALCADADRLDDRVSGIVAGTFGDAIPKVMLSHELQAELDAKAEAAALAAETTARTDADTALQTQISAKCEMYCGTYAGDGAEDRFISLGFTPKAVLLLSDEGVHGDEDYHSPLYGGLALAGYPLLYGGHIGAEVCDGGFRVHEGNYRYINSQNQTYLFLAFR